MVVSMARWKCHTAVVTGASSGIGAAIAIALVQCGMRVAGLARRHEKVEKLSKKLECKYGCKTLFPIKADVTKEEDILQAFEWIKCNLGPPHVLINNAGVIFNETLMEGKTENWNQVLNTNVVGLSMATREAIKHMQENCIDGHIVHINSIVGHRAVSIPNLNMYIASKHAVTALTEILRQELKAICSKIKITSVSPGVVATEIWDVSGLTSDQKTAEAVKKYPMLESEDIADAVVYALATPPHVQVHEVTVKPVGESF